MTEARTSPARRSPGSGAGRERLLEAYWSGFAAWLLGRLEGRWWPWRRRSGDVAERLRAATLDVGEALVVARHSGPAGRDRLRVTVDRWAWLIGLAALHGTIRAVDLSRVREAQRVLDALTCVRAPGSGGPARTVGPTPAGDVVNPPGRCA